jgi:hypothetical protein
VALAISSHCHFSGARDYGNSVFVDHNLHAYRDQWTFLASLGRLTPEELYSLIGAAEARDRVLAVRMPVADENGDEPWNLPTLRRQSLPLVTEPSPDRVKIVLSDDSYLDRTALPSSMVVRLIRLAAFQNPEFYQAQVMRRSTYGKPRIISCAVLHPKHVALPRGCLEELLELLCASCRNRCRGLLVLATVIENSLTMGHRICAK